MFPQDEVGDRLGRYEVLRKLATGGMAEIYLGRMHGAAGFEKLCVLKRILPAVALDKKLVEMFLDEARLSANLHHPNIADVFDLGSEAGSYFYAMEFIHGQDARAIRVKSAALGRPVPLDISLAIVHGVASALEYAHDKVGADGRPLGIIHRDISPGNILISYEGAVKLCDFGIARATTRASDTKTGTLKGKIPYMSPEQLQGQKLDHRSDLFALGIVLYELTVGCRPFRGPSEFAIMERIVNHAPKPPSQVIPGYPAELERIVLKLLANKPERRYQHAREVVADIEADTERLGLTTSPLLLGKYMRALFPDELAAWETAMQRGTSLGQHITDTAQTPAIRDTLETSAYEALHVHAEPRSHRAATELDPNPFGAENGTLQGIVPFPDLRPPAPMTLRPSQTIIDERPFAAEAGIGAAPPLDDFPNVASDVLDDIEPGLIGRPRFEALAARATAAHAAGDLRRAVMAAELALEVDDAEPVAPPSLRLELTRIFDAYLGDRTRHPVLARPLEDLATLPIAPESAFLLSRIDGMLSLDDLLDICGMPRESAIRQLCQLYLLGLLV